MHETINRSKHFLTRTIVGRTYYMFTNLLVDLNTQNFRRCYTKQIISCSSFFVYYVQLDKLNRIFSPLEVQAPYQFRKVAISIGLNQTIIL